MLKAVQENLPARLGDTSDLRGASVIRSRGLDSADYKQRQAADVDRTIGVEAWATGAKNFENSPNDEFVRGVGADIGPRVIPASQTLSDEDRTAVSEGRAIVGYAHNAQLSDADRALIESGKAVVLPEPIPSNRTDNLSAKQLADLASGAATLSAPTKEASAEYSRNRHGELEVPSDSINKALTEGATSLEDVAAGRTRLVS